ncbi:S1 family peptidase [Bdellovibrio svalbardensis]|uniref:Trypsin-like serine protease n=1 Tax=Bdellovibrio svalbardensis TaxID=2972972 RepID=A0ABT6DKT6_9BACT|nr:trypsin-like serine protease [Bdellovibrio svalbardensis]MDG0817478.1 trypsin-like serine protease [Bdellovibrio svalbardensis]
MKASLIGITGTLALSLSFLTACSGGGSSNANDNVEAQNCEVSGSSYGIIGGNTLASNTPLSESTVMVIHLKGEDAAICTGTLIDDDKVLTAAHCTSRDSSEKTIIAFSNNVTCVSRAIKRTARPVIAQEIHPSYRYGWERPENATNDLAVLKFSGSVPAGYKVRPLPSASYDATKATEIVMSGYGRTDEDNGDSTGTLRFTTASPSRLKKSFYMKYVKQEFTVDKTIVVEQPYNGVCSGDSGGPLYAKDANGLTLIGVTSMVADVNSERRADMRVCHGIGLFVDVRAQLDWIEKSMRALN